MQFQRRFPPSVNSLGSIRNDGHKLTEHRNADQIWGEKGRMLLLRSKMREGMFFSPLMQLILQLPQLRYSSFPDRA